MAQYCMAGVGEEMLLLFSLKFSVGFNINLVADCWYCHTFLYSLFLAFFSQGFEYVCTKNGVDIYQGTVPGSQVYKALLALS